MHEGGPGLVPEQLPTAALLAHRKGNGLGVEQHLQDRLPAGENLFGGGGGGASQALVGRQQAGAVVGGEHPLGLLLLLPGQLLPDEVVVSPGEGELKVGAVQLIERAHRRRHGHQLAEQAVHLVVGEQQRLTVFIFLLFLLRLLFPIFLLLHLMRVQEKGVEELNELLCRADHHHLISVEVTEGATKVADQVPALGGGGNETAFQRLRLEAVEEEEVVPVSGDEDDEEEGGAGATKVVVVGKMNKGIACKQKGLTCS